MNTYGVDSENELHDRRLGLGKLLDQFAQISKDLKDANIEFKRVDYELTKDEENLLENEHQKLHFSKIIFCKSRNT
jgi:hypothetical protein